MIASSSLTGPRRAPAAGGPPRQIVVLLHGVGSDGNDLIELAPCWAPLLPHAEFLSPHAPEPYDMAPVGHQWFSLREQSQAAMLAGARGTAALVDAFLDAVLAERGLDARHLALVGFSQGTMMALHVAVRRSRPVAAVLGYSGMLLGPEVLPAEIMSTPPTLLVHGDADPVVPPWALQAAHRALGDNGVPVETLVRPGLAHGIDMEGLKAGGLFLQTHLAAADRADDA